MFTRIEGAESGIVFENVITESDDFNILDYLYFYNGGGTAVGDINNDGLPDIFLAGNQVESKLYLNKGDFQFEDITAQSGTADFEGFATGVTMLDVNSDGWPDLYVCNSGDIEGDNRENELYINNGDGTFKEQASQYGIADGGFSIHSSFFDYDKDGDLDLYLLNNSYRAIHFLNRKSY